MYQVQPEILDISKALGEDTRFAIFRQIASADAPLTVKDLVSLFGMHHSAIRIHLSKLEEAGLIISRKQHNRGAVGRPQLAFLPNPKAMSISLPARNYELLADLVLELAHHRGMGGDAAVDFGNQWGRSWIRSRGRTADGALPFEEALAVLVEELQAMGNAPQAMTVDGRQAAFLQTNCPFFELAERHNPLVCALHKGIGQGMLSELTGLAVAWQQASTLAGGETSCRCEVALVEAAG